MRARAFTRRPGSLPAEGDNTPLAPSPHLLRLRLVVAARLGREPSRLAAVLRLAATWDLTCECVKLEVGGAEGRWLSVISSGRRKVRWYYCGRTEDRRTDKNGLDGVECVLECSGPAHTPPHPINSV
jgi:hypothetical protein